jgi:hypothetical protein
MVMTKASTLCAYLHAVAEKGQGTCWTASACYCSRMRCPLPPFGKFARGKMEDPTRLYRTLNMVVCYPQQKGSTPLVCNQQKCVIHTSVHIGVPCVIFIVNFKPIGKIKTLSTVMLTITMQLCYHTALLLGGHYHFLAAGILSIDTFGSVQ